MGHAPQSRNARDESASHDRPHDSSGCQVKEADVGLVRLPQGRSPGNSKLLPGRHVPNEVKAGVWSSSWHSFVVIALHLVQQVIVYLREVRHPPIAVLLAQQGVRSTLEQEPAGEAPVRAPAVADDPEFCTFRRLAPASHLHDVIDVRLVVLCWIAEDAIPQHAGVICVVLDKLWGRHEGAGYGAPRVDLLHHGRLSGHLAVIAHAVANERRLAPAGPGLEGVVGVRRHDAEAIPADVEWCALLVEGGIREAGFVRHLVLMHELVDHDGIAAVASRRRAGPRGIRDAVHQRLSREDHIRKTGPAHDLDPVVQG
mmetsp:Transcript_50264/g.145766  ORF Transcript_50264/g.145766 Transcript_50264/m.145766 type:complete len:313 (+) Transcript_50264:274-1212(+)